MVTVVRLPGDERAQALGEGLGDAFLTVIQEREKRKKEEERKKALQTALALFSAGMRGEKQQTGETKLERGPDVPQRSLRGDDKGQARRPLPADKNAVPTVTAKPVERDIVGQDVASLLLAADVDEKFAFTLAAGLDEAKRARDEEAKKSVAIGAALEVAAQQGATRQDIIGAINNSDVDPDTKIKLLTNVDKFVEKSADEKDFTIKLYTKDGLSVDVPVPPSVAQNQEARKAYVEKNFPGYSADPVAKPDKPGQDTIKEAALKKLVAEGKISQEMADKHAAGLIRITNPDQTGRFSIVDLSNNRVVQRGGEGLTTTSLTRIESRISSLSDAIYLLERTDPTNAGILNTLSSEVGGIAIQIPVLRSIAEALGLSEEEVAQVQAGRGQFFTALMPLAQSFSEGGTRSGLATKQQTDLAMRIQNMVRMSSTPAGATLAKQELLTVLRNIRSSLIAQRLSRSVTPPVVIQPKWELGDDGEIRGTLPEDQ